MAKYTFELRELFTPIKFNPPLFTRDEVEGWFKDYNLEDYLTSNQINTIIQAGIWNKNKLASQIVDHYYMRESGFETPALFKHYAKVQMQELMEEYLPLIYSASIDYDVLVNVDYTESFTRNVDNEGSSSSTSSGTGTSSGSGSSLSIFSDTPQGQITKANILAGNYATNTNGNESTSTSSSTSSASDSTTTASSQDETYTKRVKGNSGVSATAQRMIAQYRDNIRAINREIIEKLNYLFMGLY